jgi:hypothetical protein
MRPIGGHDRGRFGQRFLLAGGVSFGCLVRFLTVQMCCLAIDNRPYCASKFVSRWRLDPCKTELNRQAKPSLKDRLATITAAGQNRPRSALPRAVAIGVNFVKELPARRAEVLSIKGSVGAPGGPAFFKNREALSAAPQAQKVTLGGDQHARSLFRLNNSGRSCCGGRGRRDFSVHHVGVRSSSRSFSHSGSLNTENALGRTGLAGHLDR